MTGAFPRSIHTKDSDMNHRQSVMIVHRLGGALLLAAACSGTGIGKEDAGSGEGIFATIGGKPFAFTEKPTSSTVLSGRKFIAELPLTPYGAPSLQVSISNDAPGAFDCKAAPTGGLIDIVPGAAGTDVFTSNAMAGTCSIQMLKVAKASGESWMATFSATLVQNGGGDTLQVTEGRLLFKQP
jgi:hypothetical protein